MATAVRIQQARGVVPYLVLEDDSAWTGYDHDRYYRLYGIDVEEKRNAIPDDYLSKLKTANLEQGGTPSAKYYGWVRAEA